MGFLITMAILFGGSIGMLVGWLILGPLLAPWADRVLGPVEGDEE